VINLEMKDYNLNQQSGSFSNDVLNSSYFKKIQAKHKENKLTNSSSWASISTPKLSLCAHFLGHSLRKVFRKDFMDNLPYNT
jgi:hypothetical protein